VSYFQNPLLLSDGFSDPTEEPDSLSRIDFGVAESQSVKGRIWLDFYPNAQRDSVSLIPDYYVLNPAVPIGTNESWFFDYQNSDWYIINADGEANYWGPHEDNGDNDFTRPGGGTPQFRQFAEQTIEPWLNGRSVELIDRDGNVVATTVSRNVDVNGDGVIQLETERGWYVFENVPAGDYTVQTVAANNWIQTAPGTLEQSTIAGLDANLDFRSTGSDFKNWGGRNERWLIDRNSQWYYIMEDGGLYQWTVGTSVANGLRGTLIAQLTADYYHDLSLVTEPESVATMIHVDPDKDPIELFFGSHKLLDSLLQG
jgi:hypothetical protein